MSLTLQEFERLEALSYLKLSSEEKEKFLITMNGIISFIERAKDIDMAVQIGAKNISPVPQMHIESASENFSDTDALFANVQHEKAGNGIVIKSVFD